MSNWAKFSGFSRSAGRNKHERRQCPGFSLLELAIVLLIILTISVIAVPNIVTVVSNARLRGGVSNLSGLLQSGRMLAVKENRTKTTRFTIVANQPVAHVKNATDTSGLASTDPQVQLGAPLTKVTTPSGPGAPAALTSATLGFSPQTGDPSFGHHGLPCAYSGGNCANAGFVYYFKDARPYGQSGWAAVSISPAGRINRWFWNGSSWVG